MKKYRHVFSALILFCAIAATLTASCFVFLHSDHDCIGDGCRVCEQIEYICDVVKRVFSAMPSSYLGSFTWLFAPILALTIKQAPSARRHSLADAKVRLNN
jgi:hypothetical protein